MTSIAFDNAIDRAVLGKKPIAIAGLHGGLEDMPEHGSRFVVAQNGVFIECESDCLHFRGQIGAETNLPLGVVDSVFTLKHGPLPASIMANMQARARDRCPVEWAGLVRYIDGQYALHEPDVLNAGPGRVSYLRNQQGTGALVVDVHSHGAGKAYFSATDDADDGASSDPVFVSMVLGLCDAETPQVATRVVCGGWAFGVVGGHVHGMGRRLMP